MLEKSYFQGLDLTLQEQINYLLCKIEILNILKNYQTIYRMEINEDLICSKLDLDKALNQLKREDRVLVFLYYNKGFTEVDIANLTGINRRTVSYRLNRSIHFLVESCINF